jgi:Ricin-type beta-trefoil lectin domain
MRLTRTLSAVTTAAVLSLGLMAGAAHASAPKTNDWANMPDANQISYNECVDADSNNYPNEGDLILEYTCNNHDEQLWEGFNYQGQNVWQIKNESGLCLDADSRWYPTNSDDIQLWPCATGTVPPEQLWHLTSGSGYSTFHVEADADWGVCLSFGPEFPYNTAVMELWACDGTVQQDIVLDGFASLR